VLTFRNFSLRCDKSNPQVSFKIPWDWELAQGKRIALITRNSFLDYQLIAGFAGLVPPMSGEMICNGAISWPVGGAGGLDRRLRISDALDFVSTVYRDCLEKSRVSVDEFWQLLSRVGVHRRLLVKELSRDQRDFFYLALSLLFSFDCYLIEKSKALTLLSDSSRPLRALFRRQIEGKTLLTTSTSKRFLREFCTDGLVLGTHGEILFSGDLSTAVEWADQNLQPSGTEESNNEPFEMGSQFKNDESSVDLGDDF
jgi:capsular polysaccharide transport system ATP-binding protein